MSRTFFSSKSKCQTVLIQIRPDVYVEPDLGPNSLQRISADDSSSQSESQVFLYSAYIALYLYLNSRENLMFVPCEQKEQNSLLISIFMHSLYI